jgi:hypothetical protein
VKEGRVTLGFLELCLFNNPIKGDQNMTHQPHPSVIDEVVQSLAEQGLDGMAQAMELLINECMKIERQQALGVGPYQRGKARRGQANGSSPRG